MLVAFPSRISTVFYVGLEGLGGIDMDNEEDENVSGYYMTIDSGLIPLPRGLRVPSVSLVPLPISMTSPFALRRVSNGYTLMVPPLIACMQVPIIP